MTPAAMTFLGLALVLTGSFMVATGRLVSGGWVIAAGSLLDGLDGAVARASGRVTAHGAFLDAAFDRIGEIAAFGGLAFYLEGNARLLLLIVLSVGGAMLVPYMRAKAEAEGLPGQGGLMGRPERLILFCSGARHRLRRGDALDLRRAGVAHGHHTIPAVVPFHLVKDLLAYLGLRLGAGLIGVLPGNAIRALGRGFGGVWARTDERRRAMAERHATRVLADGANHRAASIEMMRSYGRYYAEALWARAKRVPGMLADTEIVGLEHILAARDAGTGMIFALPHMGNWEAAAPVAVSQGMPVVAVAEVLPNRRITDWFTEMRSEFGIEIVLATGRVEVMRRLEEAIAANKAVALLSDRDLKGKGCRSGVLRRTDDTAARPRDPGGAHRRSVAPGGLLLPGRRIQGRHRAPPPGTRRGFEERESGRAHPAIGPGAGGDHRPLPGAVASRGSQLALRRPRRMMRIALVSPYDLGKSGGVQAQVLGLAESLTQIGGRGRGDRPGSAVRRGRGRSRLQSLDPGKQLDGAVDLRPSGEPSDQSCRRRHSTSSTSTSHSCPSPRWRPSGPAHLSSPPSMPHLARWVGASTSRSPHSSVVCWAATSGR